MTLGQAPQTQKLRKLFTFFVISMSVMPSSFRSITKKGGPCSNYLKSNTFIKDEQKKKKTCWVPGEHQSSRRERESHLEWPSLYRLTAGEVNEVEEDSQGEPARKNTGRPNRNWQNGPGP